MPTARLADVAVLNPPLGIALSPDTCVSFLPMAAVDAPSLEAVDRETRPYFAVSKGYVPFRVDDVLVAKITPCFENGKIALAKPSRQVGFGSTEFHVLRPKADVLDPRFLAHYLRQDRIRLEGRQKMTGSAGQRRVPEHFLADLAIPLPPLSEQHRISEILDSAEALRAKRRAALAQLDALTQAIFFDMFGDPVSNPKGLPRRRVGEIAAVITGNTPPRAKPQFYGDAIEWVKSDNLNTPCYFVTRAAEGLSEAGRQVGRTAPANSILVTCIAGTPDCIGNAAMANREVAFNQQINAVIPRAGNPHFVYGQLRVGKRLVQQASTEGMKGMVSKSRFESIVLLWPEQRLQDSFARRVLAVEATISKQRASIDRFDELFASLQHRAFRGEL